MSNTMAQKPDSTIYPIVIKFQSKCCGVPDDAPLKSSILSFKKKYKIKKITALHIGPMGREGEYYLAFSLKELSSKKQVLFIKNLINITPKLKSRGYAAFEEDMKISGELPGRATIKETVF